MGPYDQGKLDLIARAQMDFLVNQNSRKVIFPLFFFLAFNISFSSFCFLFSFCYVKIKS